MCSCYSAYKQEQMFLWSATYKWKRYFCSASFIIDGIKSMWGWWC